MTATNSAARSRPRLGLKPGQKTAVLLHQGAARPARQRCGGGPGHHIGGDRVTFARMTRTARQLGMDNTTFKNANGLTAGRPSVDRPRHEHATPSVLRFPVLPHLLAPHGGCGIATVTNTNSRFLDDGADGIKTGYTAPAGFNLTASAHRGNKHIIATVFGGNIQREPQCEDGPS